MLRVPKLLLTSFLRSSKTKKKKKQADLKYMEDELEKLDLED
jgi:hypothetical protein